jgi:hypothetical protein
VLVSMVHQARQGFFVVNKQVRYNLILSPLEQHQHQLTKVPRKNWVQGLRSSQEKEKTV